MQPREAAQIEAEKTFEGFMLWSKRVALYSALFLLVVVVGCNSGVEDGQYPAYNGDQYSPSGIGTK